MYHFLCGLIAGLLGVAICRAAEPFEELRSFTDFHDVDLKKLTEGDIASLRGSLMAFPRGVSVQSCFFAGGSAKDVAEAIQTWNPSAHEPLGVYAHHAIQSPPQTVDFDWLSLDPGKLPVCWLVGKTLAVKAGQSELQISRAEAGEIAAQATGSLPGPELASRCWKNILMSRATAFQKSGIAAVPPYEMGNVRMTTADEIQNLLKENPRIVSRFSRILGDARLIESTATSNPSATQEHYCELLTVEDHAAVDLGAIYLKPSGNSYQVVDCEYYVSDGYYASLTLYEVWPVPDGSLVWRADLVSSPTLSMMKGTDRLASGMIMVLEIKKAIRFFQEDLRKGTKKN